MDAGIDLNSISFFTMQVKLQGLHWVKLPTRKIAGTIWEKDPEFQESVRIYLCICICKYLYYICIYIYMCVYGMEECLRPQYNVPHKI